MLLILFRLKISLFTHENEVKHKARLNKNPTPSSVKVFF